MLYFSIVYKLSKISVREQQHRNDLYTLQIYQAKRATNIKMEMIARIYNTQDLPWTISLLKEKLPSIFSSKCFNDNKYSFAREARRTEIGHLFEHILLEYLCKEKIAHGIKNPLHNGWTHWNWEEDALGVFHIKIDSGFTDAEIFDLALIKSIQLLNSVFQAKEIQAGNY